jgi:cytoskeletal protein CcmA (bactofilin family)
LVAETIISERSYLEGTFKTEESIRVRGTVRGQVESGAAVVVEPQGNVAATVIAASVTVSGRVEGQIVSSGRVELTPSARVSGEVTAGALVMQEGAFFEGNLKMASSGSQAAVSPRGSRDRPAPQDHES